MASDEETPWTRQLLVTGGVLVAVAVVIGVVVGVFAVGAAQVTGLGDSKATTEAKPSLVLPSGRPTTGLETYPDPSGGPSRSASASASPSDEPTTRPKPISLQALPKSVAANQKITLTGTYAGHEGARLQVQRLESGAWVDFPVDAGVSGGQFSTYITTGRSGVNRLRMVDKAGKPGSRASAPVTVTVR